MTTAGAVDWEEIRDEGFIGLVGPFYQRWDGERYRFRSLRRRDTQLRFACLPCPAVNG